MKQSNQKVSNHNLSTSGISFEPFVVCSSADKIQRPIRKEISWCMLLADDIILVDETRNLGKY